MWRLVTAVFAALWCSSLQATDYGYSKSAVSQSGYTGSVEQGAQDVIIIRISVTTLQLASGSGCNPGILNSVTFSVSGNPGTTSIVDVSNVDLWYTTTSSSFVAPVLIGSQPAAASMIFTVNEAFCSVATFYYWLTYDVAGTAQVGNKLDASVITGGISFSQSNGTFVQTPTTNDPLGSRSIICSAPVAPSTPVLSALNIRTQPSLATNVASTGVSIGLNADGTVWSAGSDQLGEMGDGQVGNPNTTNNTWVMVPTVNVHNIKQVTLGFNTALALRDDGTVWGWGDNWWGKIGCGSSGNNQPTPQQALISSGIPLTGAVKVLSSYNYTVALTADHNIYAWGNNSDGQFGPSYTMYSIYSYAKHITDDGLNYINWAIDIGAGDDYLTILRWDGTIWTMGDASFGQLGNGTTYGPGSRASTPVAAVGVTGCEALKHIKQVSAGRRFVLAIDSFGNGYGWGLNNYGQTGTGKGPDVYTPKPILGLNCNGTLANLVQVFAAGDNGYAIDQSGNLYAWGYDGEGQLANGSPPDSTCNCPKLVSTGVSEVQAGLNSVLVRKTDGCVYGAGNNWYGNLGGPLPASCCGYVSSLTKTHLVTTCEILPIELISFTAEQSGNEILLRWKTLSEVNNEKFQVERLQDDGMFGVLATVHGNGTSFEPHEYSYADNFPQAGINYYRLNQVDFDGTTHYSVVVAITFPATPTIKLIALTAGEKPVAIIQSHVNDNAIIEAIDLNGIIKWSHSFTLQQGVNRIEMSIPESVQLLLIRLKTGSVTITEKLFY